MAKAQDNGTPKIILLAVVILAALGLAIWKGAGIVAGGNPDEATFKPKVQPRADNDFVRVKPGGAPKVDKTGGGE
ncbi:hypothetical protein BH11ARM2_BH11ARM2_11910 [soil metagenome]